VEYYIDYDSCNTQLHNWIQQYDLFCVSDKVIGLIGSVAFAGWAATTLVIPPIADKIGRRFIIFASASINFVIFICILSIHEVKALLALMFIAGALTPGRGPVGFMLACEYLTPDQKLFFSSLSSFIDGVVLLVITLFYWFIDNHYRYVSSIGLLLNLFAIIGLWLIIPESPLWQLKSGQKQKAIVTLHKMFEFNGVQEMTIDRIE